MWLHVVISIFRPWSARPDVRTAEATSRATRLGRMWPSAVSRLTTTRTSRRTAMERIVAAPNACRHVDYGDRTRSVMRPTGGVLCRPFHGAHIKQSASRGVSDPHSARENVVHGQSEGVAHATACGCLVTVLRPASGPSHDRRCAPAYTSSIPRACRPAIHATGVRPQQREAQWS
jgi:hypothetical protein